MIHREDMLELTRRMTTQRTSFTRIAGGYMDAEGFLDGSFNIHFLKLKESDRAKNIALAKAIPFSKTNEQLIEYEIPKSARGQGSIWQLIDAIKECGLKNDALMETFYEMMGEQLKMSEDYGIFVFHDCYDIPVKGADKERQWESEEVYEYIIVSVFPVGEDYEPGKPVCGFLYPSFANRSSYVDHVAVFNADADNPHEELVKNILKLR